MIIFWDFMVTPCAISLLVKVSGFAIVRVSAAMIFGGITLTGSWYKWVISGRNCHFVWIQWTISASAGLNPVLCSIVTDLVTPFSTVIKSLPVRLAMDPFCRVCIIFQ